MALFAKAAGVGAVLVAAAATGAGGFIAYRTAFPRPEVVSLAPPRAAIIHGGPTSGPAGAAAVVSAAGGPVPEKTRRGVTPKKNKGMSRQELLAQQLQATDPAEHQRAVAAVRAFAAEQRNANADPRPAIKLMLDDKQYADAEALALDAIVAQPESTMTVADAALWRAQALLGEGKYDEALVEAKRSYDVATLKNTSRALPLLAEAFGKSSGGGAAIAARFLAQQQAGTWSAGSAAAPADGEANVLSTIRAEAGPYAAALAQARGNDAYDGRMALGNLLLLAGQPVEARQAFRAAAESAKKGKLLSAAIEGVARAVRAERGIVGPANALISSLASADPSAPPPAEFTGTDLSFAELQNAARRIPLAELPRPAGAK